jgi:drug/metabolite transporter (DMT)-like permease
MTQKTTPIIFFATCFLWGFTWIMGKYQINAGILPEIAVSYRFIGVSIMMFFFTKIFKQSIKLKISDIKILLPYSFCCGSLNFIMFYYAADFMITSISAIVFSFSIVVIAMMKYVFAFTNKIKHILFSAFIGILGLFFVMLQKLTSISASKDLKIGLIFAILGTLLYSSGLLFYERKGKGVLLQSIASSFYVSLCGIFITFIAGVLHHIFTGTKINLIPDFSSAFALSYIYLVVSGMGLLFMMILTQRIGAVNTSYINLITPVVAIFVSSIFENYTVMLSTIIGITLIIIGNYMALKKKG